MNNLSLFSRLFVFSLLLIINACGGGGGYSSGGGGGGTTYALSGVAAGGDPLASAAITLKDQNGQTKSGTSNADGTFSINITGLTPPFLLKAVSADTKTTYFGAVAGAANSNLKANIHKYTDVAVRAYYAALSSSDAATVFNGVSSTTVLPSQTDLSNFSKTLGSALQPTMVKIGVANPASFDIFTTPFAANQTGFDMLLKNTAYTAPASATSAAAYKITTTDANGTLTQDGTVSTSSGMVSINNKTTNQPAGGTATTSSSSANVRIAATTQQQQTDQQAAIAAVKALWTNLAAVVTQKGNTLQAADIAPFLDSSYLDRGEDAAALGANAVQFFGGNAVSFDSIGTIYNFGTDSTSGITRINAEVVLKFTPAGAAPFLLSVGGVDSGDDGRLGIIYKKQSDGSYKLYGDQTPAYMNLFVDSNRGYTKTGAGPRNTSMEIHARAPFSTQPSQAMPLGVGSISSVSVANTNGNSLLPNCAGNPPYAVNSSAPFVLSQVQKNGGAVTEHGQETFANPTCMGSNVSNTPPAGTRYEVTFNKSGGGKSVITAEIHSQSDEAVQLLSINGQDPATYLSTHSVADVIGKTLTLSWKLPTTFAVHSIAVQADPTDVNGSGDPVHNDHVDPGATSASSPIIPAKLKNGNNTVSVNGGVQFFGSNGERISAYFTIQ